MKTSEKIERLAKYEAKATNTMNAKTGQAHKHNAYNRLNDLAAAQCILDKNAASDDRENAVNYLYGQFISTMNAKIKGGKHDFEASFSNIKASAKDGGGYLLAMAVGPRGFDYAAAIRGIYAHISAIGRAAKALAWERTTAERAAKAEAEGTKKSRNAAKRAKRAAAKAEAIRQGIGEENAAKLLAAYDQVKADAAAKRDQAQAAENAKAAD